MTTLRQLSIATACATVALCSSAQAQSWQRVSPPGAGFSIQLPGAPEASTQNVSTAVGPVAMHIYAVTSNSEAFMVAYSNFPIAVDPQRAFDGARDSAFASGRVLWESNTALNGYPGRTIVGTKGAFNATIRMYLAAGRFYQVLYLSQGSGGLPPSAVSFFDSFRIARVP